MALCGSQCVHGDDDDDDDDDDEYYDAPAGEAYKGGHAGAKVDDEEDEFGDPADCVEKYYDEDGEDDEDGDDDEDDEDDYGSHIKETFAKATGSRHNFNWTLMARGFHNEEDALAACDGKWFLETDEVRFSQRAQLDRIIDGAAKWKDRSPKVLVPDRKAETKRKLDCHSGYKCDCSLRVVGYENNTPGPCGVVEIKRLWRIEWNRELHNHVYVSIHLLSLRVHVMTFIRILIMQRSESHWEVRLVLARLRPSVP
jgi:hypothetical protein